MGIVNNYEAIRTKTVAIVGVGGVGSGKFLFVHCSVEYLQNEIQSNSLPKSHLKFIVKLSHPEKLTFL